MDQKDGSPATVICEKPLVCQGLIELKKISQTAIKSTPNHRFRNIVTAPEDTTGHTLQGRFGAGQRQNQNTDFVARGPSLTQPPKVALARQSRFERKRFLTRPA